MVFAPDMSGDFIFVVPAPVQNRRIYPRPPALDYRKTILIIYVTNHAGGRMASGRDRPKAPKSREAENWLKVCGGFSKASETRLLGA